MFKGAIKSWTIWFGIALQVFSEVLLYMPQFKDDLSADTYSLIIKLIGLIVIVLRVITTKPLVEK